MIVYHEDRFLYVSVGSYPTIPSSNTHDGEDDDQARECIDAECPEEEEERREYEESECRLCEYGYTEIACIPTRDRTREETISTGSGNEYQDNWIYEEREYMEKQHQPTW